MGLKIDLQKLRQLFWFIFPFEGSHFALEYKRIKHANKREINQSVYKVRKYIK